MAARKIARVDFKGKALQVTEFLPVGSSRVQGSKRDHSTASERRRNVSEQGRPDLAGQSLSSLHPEACLFCPPCLSFSQGFTLKSPSLFLTIGLRICKPHFQEIQAALEPSTSIQAALSSAQPQPYDCAGASNTSLLFQYQSLPVL